jgi:MFS family permease
MVTLAPAADRHALNRSEVRTLALAALGGALEYYDFIIRLPRRADRAAVLSTGHARLAAPAADLSLFAAGYLARPLGGVIMAHFGDRSGRKRMFMLSVLMMAVPTLLIGLLPTYADIGYAAPLALLLRSAAGRGGRRRGSRRVDIRRRARARSGASASPAARSLPA